MDYSFQGRSRVIEFSLKKLFFGLEDDRSFNQFSSGEKN